MAFCGVPWKDRWEPGDGFDHAEEYESDLFSITSLIQAGAIFRYEIRRWQLYARLGLGIRPMAYDTPSKTKVFGKELSVRLGFQFQCELSGSGKKKNKATKKAP